LPGGAKPRGHQARSGHGYITNQLLRALTAIEHETENKDATIVIDSAVPAVLSQRASPNRNSPNEIRNDHHISQLTT